MSFSNDVRTDYKKILKDGCRIIDVRSPSEYQLGSIRNAINLPILDDEKRKKVGTCYKKNGQTAAIALGYELVSENIKENLVDSWTKAVEKGSLICCWRGGLRSIITQNWLQESGVNLPRISGGYKALRRTCIEVIQDCSHENFIVIAGRTGSGKTEVIRSLVRTIDLEGLANHRGSAFGHRKTPQPPLASFENNLATTLLQMDRSGPIAIEDESRTIGHLAVPLPLFDRMRISPIVVLETPIEERVENIYQEYVVRDDNPNNLLGGIDRIKKRLGGKLHSELRDCMTKAFDKQNKDLHQRWIIRLLSKYYDPMYDYQIQNKYPRVIYRGEKQDVLRFLSTFEIKT